MLGSIVLPMKITFRSLAGLVILLSSAALSEAWGNEPSAGAMWELRMLGVDDGGKLAELRDAPKKRRVRLGVVGQEGVSGKGLGELLEKGNSISCHGCEDPGHSTHDTGQLRVVLELTSALGVEVDLHVWQPGRPTQEVASGFREAGRVCDVVCFFQSYWGSDAALITEAIRESSAALFVSPYVEHGGKPTSEPPQGSACKPWVADSIGHFVLAAPLSRRNLAAGILTPTDRGPTDSEAINFIAPSYYANGPGGTCPAGATTTGCAVYLVAVMAKKPSPADVIELLRANSRVDRNLLASAGGMDEPALDGLLKKIDKLRSPASGKQQKLDAPGVLNLYEAYRKSVTCSAGP